MIIQCVMAMPMGINTCPIDMSLYCAASLGTLVGFIDEWSVHRAQGTRDRAKGGRGAEGRGSCCCRIRAGRWWAERKAAPALVAAAICPGHHRRAPGRAGRLAQPQLRHGAQAAGRYLHQLDQDDHYT